MCISIGLIYSILFEMIATDRLDYTDAVGVKLILHFGINLLGIHLFILTQGEHPSGIFTRILLLISILQLYLLEFLNLKV